MNFLAHIYLSGIEPDIKIGNFIGDYVKGKALHIYPDKIQQGILLHRFIDSFTDKHANTLEAKSLFAPKYRKYAGIVIDIIYDHFLATNWNKYSRIDFRKYIDDFHKLLKNNESMLPSEVQKIVPKLIKNDRIFSYKEIEGIRAVLQTMPIYTSLPDYSDYAIKTLEENYNLLMQKFFIFFKDIIYYIKTVHNISFDNVI